MLGWLYYCGITGGVFTVLALLLRARFKKYFPRRTSVLLMTLAVLLLLLPLRFRSPLSVYNLVPAVPQSVLNLSREAFDAPDPEETEEFETVYSEQGLSAGVHLWRIFTCAWLAGSLLLTGLLAVAYAVSFRRFKDAVPVKGARAYWGAWCRVRVYRSDKTASPMVVGVLFPRIILPASLDFEDTKFVDYIIEHELTHIRRFDNLLKFASALTVCIYWFNPAVWLLHRSICKDIELSCDEAVLASFGQEKKNRYVKVMVSAAEKFSTENRPLRGREVFVMFGENDVRERIENILRFKNTTAATFVLAAAVLLGLSAVFATDATGGSVQSASAEIGPERAEKIAFGRLGRTGVLVRLEHKVDKRG